MPLAANLHYVPPPRCCAGKEKYRTRDRAGDGMVRLLEAIQRGEREDRWPGYRMSVYQCPYCHYWRYGHQPRTPQGTLAEPSLN
jgi:hypothetical protein